MDVRVTTDSFHYPPDLLALLVDTIPLLCRGKRDVLTFFKGAGVGPPLLADLEARLRSDRQALGKHEISRTVILRLNERGDGALRERREVLKRVVEFEDFSVCWPDDQLKARGLVASIRELVHVKDSFTRMQQEREQERKQRAEPPAKGAAVLQRTQAIAAARAELGALFTDGEPHRRGKQLEGVLNRLFAGYGVLVRESFTVSMPEANDVGEQIDGVIEVDGELYLVEMKWWAEPLGVEDVSRHLVRVFGRGHARGIFISASPYTAPAIQACREALRQAVVILCTLREIVLLLEREGDLMTFLKEKIRVAILEKNPFHEITQG
ncbi:MAG: restriction endonuclease [Chloroflexi bacterium]|nr:restriction endonuclease [Chloroflexota bacterium]